MEIMKGSGVQEDPVMEARFFVHSEQKQVF